MLGPQQISFNYHLYASGVDENLVLMGPYGSGKTITLIMMVQKIMDSLRQQKRFGEIIIIIYEDEAVDLKNYYKNLCGSDNKFISVKVMNKSEAFAKYGAEFG